MSKRHKTERYTCWAMAMDEDEDGEWLRYEEVITREEFVLIIGNVYGSIIAGRMFDSIIKQRESE